MIEQFTSKVIWPPVDNMMSRLGRDSVKMTRVQPCDGLERLGSGDGSWVIPIDRLGADSVCYCVGCGLNISFDLDLIDRLGCSVHGFDPTPRAIDYVREQSDGHPAYKFHPVGLWDETDNLKFYVPENPEHVSHSVVNLQRTHDYILAPVDRLGRLMTSNGHRRLDLLKLDIEGAEYRVLDSIFDDGIDVAILCVEYDELRRPLDRGYLRRVFRSLSRILAAGYSIVYYQRANYTFLKQAGFHEK